MTKSIRILLVAIFLTFVAMIVFSCEPIPNGCHECEQVSYNINYNVNCPDNVKCYTEYSRRKYISCADDYNYMVTYWQYGKYVTTCNTNKTDDR